MKLKKGGKKALAISKKAKKAAHATKPAAKAAEKPRHAARNRKAWAKKTALIKKIKPAAQTKTAIPENLTKSVEPEYVFWLSDGRTIKNVPELAKAAGTMSANTYSYHANQMKNDFADWIRDIIKDEQLAYSVRKARDKTEMLAAIRKRLKGKSSEPRIMAFSQNQNMKTLLKEKSLITVPEQKSLVELHRQEAGKELAKPAETKTEALKTPAEKQTPAEKDKPEKHAQPPQSREKGSLQQTRKPEQAKNAEEDSEAIRLKKREDELMRMEQGLNEEEQRLNHARIELTKRRYELIKQRGELEKEKFERFLAERKMQTLNVKLPEIPEIEKLNSKITMSREKIGASIRETQESIEQGNLQEATRKFLEIQTAFNRSFFEPEEKRSLKFQIMELEADIKLAGLKNVQ